MSLITWSVPYGCTSPRSSANIVNKTQQHLSHTLSRTLSHTLSHTPCISLTIWLQVVPHITAIRDPQALAKYNKLVKLIPPYRLRGRVDKKGKKYDTFDARQWWLENRKELPSFFAVLRAVLTHAPNSTPPERLFSILNNTFDDDMT